MIYLLQVICVITMFLDHLGILFSLPVLRVVGRVAMPIYAYLLSVSVNKTSNLEKFSFKLFALSLISQLPYYIFVGEHRANILFTWFICADIIYIHRAEWKKYQKVISYGLLACFVFGGLKFDYGYLAILWFGFFYLRFQKHNKKAYYILVVIALLYVAFEWYIDLFALCAVPIVLFCLKYNKERIKNVTFQKIYRWFYPAHLCFLSAFKILLGGSVF